MTLSRRRFLHLAAAALPAVPSKAWATNYPARPVRLIVPFPAGGVSDVYARLFAQSLSERLGQQFFVENRPGAGGNIGTEAGVRAAPDGHTLILIATNNSFNVALYENLNFDFVRDVAAVASLTRGINVLVVHPSLPVNTVPELIAYAKSSPGKITMASGGIGTPHHVFGELFKTMSRIDMLHVPYRGGAPALTDLIAGQVAVMFETLPTAIEHIKAGRLRPLAVTSATRTPVLPDVPAVAEFLPGYEGTGWLGIGAPRNTPSDILERLHGEFNAALADEKINARLRELGSFPTPMSRLEFGRYITEYTEKWAKVIRGAGIKIQG